MKMHGTKIKIRVTFWGGVLILYVPFFTEPFVPNNIPSKSLYSKRYFKISSFLITL